MPHRLNSKAPRRFGVVFFLLCFPFITLLGKETIMHAVIAGEHPLDEKKVARITDALKGRDFSPGLAQAGAEEIRKASMYMYYPMAAVQWKASPSATDPSKLIVRYEVNKGPRGRLREIRFQGNTKLSDDVLLSSLKVLPRDSWWPTLLRQDSLDSDQLEGDRSALAQAYMEAGYAGVRIGSGILEPHPSKGGFLLTWPVEFEGEVHGLGRIGFEADTLPPEEITDRLLQLQPDQRYDVVKVEEARLRLLRYLQENGHAFAQVSVRQEQLKRERRVNLTFIIQAGRRPALRNITIEGQESSKPALILDELLMEKGEVYDVRKLEMSKLALDQMPVFAEVSMQTIGVPEAPVYDLAIQVRERKTGRVEMGLVYGDAEGAAFQFNLNEKNLDLVPPFRGGGYEGGFSATVGSEILRTELRLVDPRIKSTDWSLFSNLFYEDSELESDFYDEQSYGFTVVGAHPLKEGLTGSIGFSALVTHLDNIDREALPDLSDVDEDMRLTSLVGFLNFDDTDQSFRPTKGKRGRLGLGIGSEVLGGNVDVLQTRFKGTAFVSPVENHIMSFTFGFDGMNPYGDTETSPQSLKQFLGGGQDLRGFEYRSLSPLDEEGRPIGGDSRWWASVEYLYPLIKDRLDLALFLDVGDVSPDSFSFSGEGPVSNAGIGFSVNADNFPIRFNVAMPLETYENDRINETGDIYISFAVGYLY